MVCEDAIDAYHQSPIAQNAQVQHRHMVLATVLGDHVGPIQ